MKTDNMNEVIFLKPTTGSLFCDPSLSNAFIRLYIYRLTPESRLQTIKFTVKSACDKLQLLKPHEGLALVHSQNRNFSLEMYTYISGYLPTKSTVFFLKHI